MLKQTQIYTDEGEERDLQVDFFSRNGSGCGASDFGGEKKFGVIDFGVPCGKRLHNYGKIHHFEWENSL